MISWIEAKTKTRGLEWLGFNQATDFVESIGLITPFIWEQVLFDKAVALLKWNSVFVIFLSETPSEQAWTRPAPSKQLRYGLLWEEKTLRMLAS